MGVLQVLWTFALKSPGWCLAPFDPKGILSSVMVVITCLVGLHYGHILVQVKGHKQRIIFWSIFSFPLLIVGFVLVVVGVPLSKPLYTLSYIFITAGALAIVFTIIYYIVNVICLRKPMIIYQWMGMNALIVYALASSDIFPAALQGLYWSYIFSRITFSILLDLYCVVDIVLDRIIRLC